MRKDYFQKIQIPNDVDAKFEKGFLELKGPAGENKRKILVKSNQFELEDKQILIGKKKATKREKKIINTITSHIKNMIKGVQNKFQYKLKVCFSHFPITVEFKEREAIIKNFLGEKTPRKCQLPEGSEIKIDGNVITITSADKEKAGQAAANLERLTKIRKKDRRIFQDGIFMIEKAGKEI